MRRRVLPYGESALLVECGSLDEVLRLHGSVIEAGRPGVIDVVPGARTVALLLDVAVLPPAVAAEWVAGLPAPALLVEDDEVVTIEVDYCGEDLPEVARLLRADPADIIRLHTGSSWRVAFTGFAPGFGYLVTDHDRLHVPRRERAREAVPAGSVGLAGEFSGVYPRSSPGGWQLIGTTDALLWDAAVAQPALFVPGRAVRFRSVS